METYFGAKAIESQRSSGYKDTIYALAELIDNSFDAQATLCKVIFIERKDKGKKYIDEILICDDGVGMDKDVLQMCLQFGGTTNDDISEIVRTKKTGKFGFGLPNASISQCRSINIYSWKEKDTILTTNLILDNIEKTNSIKLPEVKSVELPSYYKDLEAVINEDHGSIVSWKDCDRLSNTQASTITRKSEELLGRLYRYLLIQDKNIEYITYEEGVEGSFTPTKKINFSINDPLFLMKDAYISKYLYEEANKTRAVDPKNDPSNYYKDFSIDKEHSKPTNHILEDASDTYLFNWKGKDYKFTINVSVADYKIQKPGIREGGSTLVGKFYGKKDLISFVRADREIASGRFKFDRFKNDATTRWFSVEVKFDADADDLMGVHNNKQGIGFENNTHLENPEEEFNPYEANIHEAKEQLWFFLSKKITNAINSARRVVRDNEKKWQSESYISTEEGGVLPGATSTTTNILIENDGIRSGQFSEDDKKSLKERLESKFPEIDTKLIENTIDRYDQGHLRGCVLYAPSESENLWDKTNVGKFLIVFINTNHNFYEKLIQPLKESGREDDLTAIELFISSLAWEEHEHYQLEKVRPQAETIEDFRSDVGRHLNRYLRDFSNEYS